MVQTLPDDAGEISAKPMDPDIAAFVRPVCTFYGLHRGCPFKVCRRANACATRNVVCYQALEDVMKPIVRSLLARQWFKMVERGEEVDIAPAGRDDNLRLLAREQEEIERIRSGTYGDDDDLTHYQLWLKNYASHPALAFAPSPRTRNNGGQPYDPDARVAPWNPPTIVREQAKAP